MWKEYGLIHVLPHHWWYLVKTSKHTHTHMCTLYARKCASAHRTTNRLFKSIQKKNYRKLNRISYAYIKWMQKRCELWSALKCAPCFQVFHVPHHWHITTRRIERPNMCWKWIHNTLNHIRNTRREDKVKEEEEKKTKNGSPLRIKSFSTTNICCVFTTYVLCCIRNVRIQIASLWFHLSHVCVHRFHISMCCMRIPHYYLQKMQMKRVLAFICWKKTNEHKTERTQCDGVCFCRLRPMMREKCALCQSICKLVSFNQQIFSALILAVFFSLFFSPISWSRDCVIFFFLLFSLKKTKLTYSIDFYQRAWQEIKLEGRKK